MKFCLWTKIGTKYFDSISTAICNLIDLIRTVCTQKRATVINIFSYFIIFIISTCVNDLKKSKSKDLIWCFLFMQNFTPSPPPPLCCVFCKDFRNGWNILLLLYATLNFLMCACDLQCKDTLENKRVQLFCSLLQFWWWKWSGWWGRKADWAKYDQTYSLI